ncbi:MAG: ABC transporter ATP-binding protein [Clostridiales bacterium]|nr:ABC transporter ATP-binding protein [Clostridiales bacterium]
MNVIEVSGLTKQYRSILAVDDISFTVEEGTIFGMLGPNGAGKSTTIECIIGLKKRNNGLVDVLGLDPAVDNEKLYNIIGVQLQETSYQDKIKVYELCDLFKTMYDTPTDYIKLLERFELSDRVKSYVSELSGGQKQKIAIVLALIANPKIVFLDELTTGLDPNARRDMWQCIKELKDEGRTVFMTTHYMEEAAFLCDKICIIHDGKIIAMDTVDGVVENSDIDMEVTFESKKDVTELLKKIKNINNIVKNNESYTVYFKDEEVIGEIILVLKDNNISFKKLNINRPNLEDVYLKLTGTKWKEID